MNRWISLVLFLFLLPAHVFSAGGYSTSIGDSDILISGQKTISYRYAFAFGTKDIFRSDNMVSLGGTINEQSTFLTINGNVPDKFSIIGTLSDGTYMGSQASIGIKAKNLSLYLGDIAANLSGGEFGSFNKNLNGIKVEGNWDKSKFYLDHLPNWRANRKQRLSRATAPWAPTGWNTAGRSLKVQETVKVDGKTQLRNQDYRIDNGAPLLYQQVFVQPQHHSGFL